jgi:hypothetical protein
VLSPKSNNQVEVRNVFMLFFTLTSFFMISKNSVPFEIDSQRQKEILSIIPTIDTERLYRGKGGELIRIAVCSLIEGISIANIPLISTTTSNVNSTTTTQSVGSVRAIVSVMEISDCFCLNKTLFFVRNYRVVAQNLLRKVYHSYFKTL